LSCKINLLGRKKYEGIIVVFLFQNFTKKNMLKGYHDCFFLSSCRTFLRIAKRLYCQASAARPSLCHHSKGLNMNIFFSLCMPDQSLLDVIEKEQLSQMGQPDRPFWRSTAFKVGVPLGVLASLLFPGRAHAQYSSMDTLGYWVKYSNGQQERHEGILVEPPDMNVMLSEDPYRFLHQDRWVTWVYNNPTDNLDNFWAGFDKLPGDKKQRYIPDYDLLRNNHPHHEPDTDGEIVELYTFDISSNDNDQSLPVDFLDAAFRARYVPDSSFVDIDWQTMSETDNLGFRVLREIVDDEGNVKQSKRDISGLIKGLGSSPFGAKYNFEDREVPEIASEGDTVNYFIEQVDISGGRQEYGPRSIIWDEAEQIAGHFFLTTNYPNPFNSSTKVDYVVPSDAAVRIDVFNMAGQRVMNVVDGAVHQGEYTANIDFEGLPSGTYFIVMKTRVKKCIYSQAIKVKYW